MALRRARLRVTGPVGEGSASRRPSSSKSSTPTSGGAAAASRYNGVSGEMGDGGTNASGFENGQRGVQLSRLAEKKDATVDSFSFVGMSFSAASSSAVGAFAGGMGD